MGLLEQIKKDIQNITSNSNEFGLPITFVTPDGLTTLEVIGLETKHHMTFDFDLGKNINAQNASVSVSEQLFIDASYPVRNAANKVSMKKHRVSFIDSTGVLGNYEVVEYFSDEKIGLIVFILGDRKV